MIASIAKTSGRRDWSADTYERGLAVAALALIAAVVVAVVKGRADWPRVPPGVWAHLASIVVALGLTPVILLRRRGDDRHRLLGRVWAAAMILTALISFTVRNSNHGGLSFIHVLSAFVLVQVPRVVLAARRHNIRAHRNGIRAMVTGALLIAGFFTFPFDRLLGHWLFL